MAEVDASEHLEESLSDHLRLQPPGVFLKLLQHRVVDELEDEEELAAAAKHLDQIDQVLVAETL